MFFNIAIRKIIPWFMAILLFLTLQACVAVPVQVVSQDNGPLVEIQAVFESLLQQGSGVESGQIWHSGWLGNIMINALGGSNRGLCHHWQQRVYDGVQPTVSRLGWHAEGVVINRRTYFEHHAVLVYDPQEVSNTDLLEGRSRDRAWVLDGWRRGQPDVYTLEQWLTLPLVHKVEMQIETLTSKKKQ